MGETAAVACGYTPMVLGSIDEGNTTGEDTRRAVGDMMENGVDLVLFVGGDGTARDVCEVAGSRVPILGVPAGVKVYSAVFGNTPVDAAKLAARFLEEDLPTREAEVMDVDEEAFRDNELKSVLKGYALTPYDPGLRQDSKLYIEAPSDEEDKRGIARCIVESMENDRLYIVGPGSTTGEVMKELGLEGTLLGVDLVLDRKLVAADVAEERILEELGKTPGAIIVSPLGQQGFILGRGNQQISSKIIRKVGIDRIIVVATPAKLQHTPKFKVDTGDPDLDRDLRRTISVIVGYWLRLLIQVE
jgi:predicted polyphosphate/ATP-dependent NAD kinase